MTGIFASGNDLNDYASLDIINLINRVLTSMTYEERKENANVVAELHAERNEVEKWRDAFLAAWEDGENVTDSATILEYMG